MTHAQLYIAKNIESSTLPEEVRVQSADVEHIAVDSFGIGDARALQNRAYVRPTNGALRHFVISFSTITVEAQNALLKLLEEPPETSVFYIVAIRSDVLLDTVRSRLSIVDSKQESIDRSEVRIFLQQSYGERIAEITARTKNKDIVWIESIVGGVEEYAHCQKGLLKQKILKEVIFIRQYLDARGASKKMLLESLALVLPVSSR